MVEFTHEVKNNTKGCDFLAQGEIFKRVEIKYRLSEEKYRSFIGRMSEFLEKDKFYFSEIKNIYYDTPDSRIIRNSIEKPCYKEKFRVRSYEGFEDVFFLELKKKYDGIVYKRRVKMSGEQAKLFLDQKKIIGVNEQIEKEILYFLEFHKGIRPTVFLSYERESFFYKPLPDLRITFDSNILYNFEDPMFEKSHICKPVLAEGERIMELKVPCAVPYEISKVLSELEIYPKSFSKYATAFKSENLSGKETTYA